VILTEKIGLAVRDQELNTFDLAISDSIKDRTLPIVVNVIGISTCFHEGTHDVQVSFPCGIEERSLSIAVNLVCLASMLDKQLGKLVDSISSNVEEARLVE